MMPPHPLSCMIPLRIATIMDQLCMHVQDGHTPLCITALTDQLCVHAQDGRTPLCIAALMDQVEVSKALMESGAIITHTIRV